MIHHMSDVESDPEEGLFQGTKETGGSGHIYQNELDKAWLQHDMAYGDFKDLTRKTAFDQILRHKAFNISKNPNNVGYQHGPTTNEL